MRRIQSTGTDLPDRENAQVIEQAKIARVHFLFGPRGRGLTAIGLSTLACILAFVFLAGAGSRRHQAFENTVIIERLATRLAHVDKISPETAAEIAQLLRRRDYDCRQLACDASLEIRNLAARSRLQTILARSTLQADAGDR